MANITVGSTAALNSALLSAHDGDTILLQSGTYTGLDYVFNNLNFANGITITSADPANPATITHFSMNNSSGITFSNLSMQTQATGFYDFQVFTSNNIHFDHVSVHGSMDGNPQDDVEGISFNGSTNISVTNSEFQQLVRALAVGSSSNVVVSNNNIHDVEVTGVQFAQVANVTMSGGAGADTFHGSQDAGIDKVLDFNQAQGDHVLLDAGTTYTVSQVGGDTVIDMGAGNEMILAGVQLSSLHSGWIRRLDLSVHDRRQLPTVALEASATVIVLAVWPHFRPPTPATPGH